MHERFTKFARRALADADSVAISSGDTLIRSTHVLIGVIGQKDGLGIAALSEMGIALDKLRATADRFIATLIDGTGERAPVSDAKRVIVGAIAAARELGHQTIGTPHLLLGLCNPTIDASRILMTQDVTPQRAREAVVKVVASRQGGELLDR